MSLSDKMVSSLLGAKCSKIITKTIKIIFFKPVPVYPVYIILHLLFFMIKVITKRKNRIRRYFIKPWVICCRSVQSRVPVQSYKRGLSVHMIQNYIKNNGDPVFMCFTNKSLQIILCSVILIGSKVKA